jgi:ABC-type transport system involved in cytochrome c biogenesis permease component
MVLALRNKMFFFFSVVMPLLFFFLYAGIFAKGDPNRVRFFLGPVLALNVMGSFWGLSATLVTFREQGILRRFHVAPVTASDLLASSVLANFILTLPTVTVVLLFARFIFHVHDLGNLPATFLFVCAGTVSFGSLGLVVASITNTMQETQVLNQLLWLPLIFLSGATFPLGYLPKVVQGISVFLLGVVVLCRCAVVPLGTRNQDSPQRQIVGRSNHYPLPVAGHLGTRQWPNVEAGAGSASDPGGVLPASIASRAEELTGGTYPIWPSHLGLPRQYG